MGGSETAQQPDKQLNERGGIGRQHVSDGCVTDAVSQCHSVRACPSAMVILHLSGSYSR